MATLIVKVDLLFDPTPRHQRLAKRLAAVLRAEGHIVINDLTGAPAPSDPLARASVWWVAAQDSHVAVLFAMPPGEPSPDLLVRLGISMGWAHHLIVWGKRLPSDMLTLPWVHHAKTTGAVASYINKLSVRYNAQEEPDSGAQVPPPSEPSA